MNQEINYYQEQKMPISMSAKIRKVLAKYPDLSPAEVAKKTKTDVSLVYAVTYALKKEMKKKGATDLANIAVFTSNRGRPKKTAPTPNNIEVKVDMVNHPPHYTKGGIETLDFIKAKLSIDEYKGYLKGNLIKYISRAGLKDEEATDFGKINFYATELSNTK